jgi:hypothetical protein
MSTKIGWYSVTQQLDIPYGMKRVPHQLLMVGRVVDNDKILISESQMLYHKYINYDNKYDSIEAVIMDVLNKAFGIAPLARVTLDKGQVGLVYDWRGNGGEDELSTAQKIWKWLKEK